MKKILSILLLSLPALIYAQDSTGFYAGKTNAFPSSQAYLETTTTPELQIHNHTVECWVYVPDSSNVSQAGFIETYFQGQDGYALRYNGGLLQAFVFGTGQHTVFGGTINLDEWTHVAATFDTVTNIHRLYLNGSEVASDEHTNFSTNSSWTNPRPVRFGARGDDANVIDDVILDEVRIWNVVRSEAEISASMNSCLEGDEQGLALYYDFENIANDMVSDKTANGHDGTVQGTDDYIWDGAFECQVASTSVGNMNRIEQLLVYPNPATETIFVTVSSNIENVRLFDISGQLIKQTNANRMSIEELNDGIYLVQVITPDGAVTKRIVKQ